MPAGYIGIDVGGTNMTGALAGADGVPVHIVRRKTDREGGAAAGLATVYEIGANLLSEARSRNVAVARLGVGFGGPVDPVTGVVHLSHQVSGWQDLPLVALLQERLGLQVVLDNDCNAATLAAWRFGAGRGVDDLLYVNIGTGIGGGVVARGALVRGAANGAGEIGHMTIDRAGPSCTCGRRGCLEALCSGPAIGRRARDTGVVPPGAGAEALFDLARQGHPEAEALVANVANDLAIGLGAAIVITNPARVVLGGGVGTAGDVLLAPLRKALPGFMLNLHAAGLEVLPEVLGYDAGVCGAVALAMEADGCL